MPQLDQLRNDGFSPTLAIAFSSLDCDLDALRKLFRQHSIDLLGASTAGEICDELVLDKSVAVLLMDLDRAAYRSWFRP